VFSAVVGVYEVVKDFVFLAAAKGEVEEVFFFFFCGPFFCSFLKQKKK